jgi:hypothetical protein
MKSPGGSGVILNNINFGAKILSNEDSRDTHKKGSDENQVL